MMTDAMKPLGISVCQLIYKLPGGHERVEAGGRLYGDFSSELTSPVGGKIFLNNLGKTDVLAQNALYKLLKRKDFIKTLSRGKSLMSVNKDTLTWLSQAISIYMKNDVAVVEKLIGENEKLMRELEQATTNLSGDDLFVFILQRVDQIKKTIFNTLGPHIVGSYVSDWLNKNMQKWLGEKNVADTLSQSVSNNVTSEMGLELLDVADVVRQYPEVIEYFSHASDENFFEDLAKLEGGDAVSNSIRTYLKKFGMRCSGEIDITKPRWSEKPTTFIPTILSNIKNFEPGARSVIFEKGRQEAEQKAKDLLSRLIQLPGGKRKAKKTKKAIDILRNFIGCREYPKYFMTCYYWIIKQALLKEAGNLVQKGIIREKEDIYYLSFEELREVVKTNRLDYNIITKRNTRSIRS